MQDRFKILYIFYSPAKIILIIAAIVFFTGCKESPSVNYVENPGMEYFDYYGCKICHSLAGQEMYGPPLDSLYNTEIEVLRNGKRIFIKADRRYIIRSIVEPEFEKVLHYSTRTMPKTDISPEKAKVIADYLISLSAEKRK